MTQTSATGRFDIGPRHRGFTLVEVLVVLAILGILSTFVALTTSPDPRREAANDAERLALLLEAAVQEAQWGGRNLAWSADAKGYRFLQSVGDRRWQPVVDDELFRPRILSEGVGVASVEVEGQVLAQGAMLEFSSSSVPLFRITLRVPQGLLVLRSGHTGKVDLEAPRPL